METPVERQNRLAREREKRREKQECCECKKLKICRYSGPLCQTCYAKFKNPTLYGKILARNKKYSKTFDGRFAKIKLQAKYRNKPFNLSKEFYKELLEKPCYYCNRLYDGGIWADRIDNSLGYYEDNILPCCGSCNQIRCIHLTVEEMKIAMEAVLSFRNKKSLGE